MMPRPVGLFLPAVAVLVSLVRSTSALPTAISVGPPPPPLMYFSYGVLQVNWTCTSCTATGFRVDVKPLDQTDTFSYALTDDPKQNPWFYDNAAAEPAVVTITNTATVNSGQGSIELATTGGSVSLTGGRGSAPYLYRKIPEGAIFEVQAACTPGSGAGQCGLVVFNAGQNRHLAFIGMEGSSNTVVSEDFLGNSYTFGAGASGWFFRAYWDETNKQLTLSAAPTSAGLETPTFRQTHSFGSAVPEIFGGDLWYGVQVRSKGGSGTFKGLFSLPRMWRRLPASKPPTITGTADTCFSKTNVQTETVTVGASVRSVTITDLSQNFPYSVFITELQGTTEVKPTEYIPHVFARPMPPRYWSLGAWYDARPLRSNTPVTGVNTAALSAWPDTSGNGHNLRAVRKPSVGFSQYNFMNQVGFDRRSANYVSGGGDMIDLGGATQFSMYTHTLLTSSSPAIIAGRGINTDVGTQIGYALMEYSDFWDPWPGQRGLRVTDKKYNLASIGFANLQRWGYLYQTNHWANFVNTGTATTTTSFSSKLYPFAAKSMQFGRTADYYGDAAAQILFPGFPSGIEANFSSYKAPISVDWTSDTNPNPALTDANLNFKIGGPINPSGDTFRSLSGQVFSVMLYREAHSTADRDAIMEFTDFYNYRRCYPIFTAVSSSSPVNVCKRGYRDDYCYQGCSSGFAQTAGTNDHWCQGGRWSGAPAVCKKACPTYNRPNFIKSCSKTLLVDNFMQFDESWNRYVVEPFAPDVVRDLMWSLDTKTGTMKAFTNDPCKGTFPSHMGMHPNRWDLIIQYGGLQVTTARVRLENANSIGGLSVHYHNNDYNYMIKFGPTIGVIAFRNTVTEIARNSALGNLFPVGQYVQVSLSVTNLYRFSVQVGNTTVFTFNDATFGPANGPSWGASGMWADGFVSFQNFSITGDCDGAGSCVAMSSGQSCKYECDFGYKPITTTNGLVTCTDSGHVGSMICMTLPPDMPPQTFFLKEHTTAGFAVGRVVATPANPRQQIDYLIVGTFPREFNQTFSIGSCSGMILVNDPSLILYRYYRNITITVKARPDGDEPGARITNHTIVIVDVDMPPIFTPLPQTLFVQENFRGVVGNVSTFDEDDDLLIFSILSGNEGNIGASGTSTGIFSVNQNTGAISTALAVDFESQSSFALLLQASEVRDRSMLGTGLINIVVIDQNDRPIIAPATVLINEFTMKQPSATNMTLTRLEAYDNDNSTANPQWSQLDYSIVTNARNGSTNLFWLDTSTMPPMVRLTQPLEYTYEMGDRDYGATKARGIYTANMSVCDRGTPKLCAYAPVTMVVIANYSAPLRPLIMKMPRVDGFDTQGNEPVTFIVRDFGEVTQINASYCGAPAQGSTSRAPRCYNATSCSVVVSPPNVDGIKTETLTCFTAPGWGKNLLWTINVVTVDATNGAVKRFTVPTITNEDGTQLVLQHSYCDPVLNEVVIANNSIPLDTSGGATFVLRGRCFGPADVDAAIQYGVNGEFSMERLTSQHTTMTGRILPGCGKDLPVRILIGGNQYSRSTNEDATKITFPVPEITSLYLDASAMTDNPPYTLNTLPTSKSKKVYLKGRNFGPASIGGAIISPVVTYANNEPNPLRYNALNCNKQANTAHTTVECSSSPGVGVQFNWTIQVCGQTSMPSQMTTSYRPPVVTDVRGAGKSGASTQGGQRLSIIGKDLGYVGATTLEMDRIVRWVRYGRWDRLQYTAENCRVMSVNPDTSDGTIDCLTTEGTGKNHSLAVNIGGQLSNVFAAGIQYGEPVIADFKLTKVAQTPGGELIQIDGVNFGKDISLVQVYYTDRPTVPRQRDGVIPGSPPGQVVFSPRSCEFFVNHTSLLCTYNEGAGRKLIWDMVVDGQKSASPSTKYEIPSIDTIELLDGATTASTRGGTRLRLTGSNFGLVDLVQSVRFGPTGREYSVNNFTLVSHFEMLVTLPPGIGQGLRFIIEVSDQSSEPSAATFNYATPQIFSVVPNFAVTDFDPRRPLLIEIRGKDFGLLDPASDALIGFGNIGDRTLQPLIRYTSRYPPSDEVAAGTFRPSNPNYEEVLQFYLPESLGQNRSVRVVPYRRGVTPTAGDVAALPVEGTRDVFSFRAPKIKYANVDGVESMTDKMLLTSVFPDITITNIPIGARKLAVNGDSFGPPQSTDLVQRIVEALEGSNPPTWSQCGVAGGTCLVSAVASNWTHNKIIAFSKVSSATIRVRWIAAGPNGELSETVSDSYTFSDVSPRVKGLTGALAGYQTAGGEWLTIQVSGLASTQVLNVTIGGRNADMYANEAGDLYTPLSTVTFIPPASARDRLIIKQGVEPFPPEFVWTVMVKVPEGEGINRPVVFIRDSVYSGDEITINYIPPAITQVGYYDNATASWKMQPFSATTPLVIPTAASRLRLIGTNLGLCPSMRFATDRPVFVDRCPKNPQTNEITINTAVTRSHTQVDFDGPEGEGTGVGLQTNGWFLEYVAGDQFASTGPVLLRYMPPTVASVTPNTGPTRGGTFLTIRGANFGYKSTPSILIGNDDLGWKTCLTPQRVSHTMLTCTLPEGVGSNLQVRVTVAFQTGTGASFSYVRPQISTVSVSRLAMTTAPDSLPPSYDGNMAFTWMTSSTTYGTGAASDLKADPAGGAIVKLVGSNFGPAPIRGASCAFSLWSSILRQTMAPRAATLAALKCDGEIDTATPGTIGEGEIKDADIISWSHEEIIFKLPPGQGKRKFTVMVGGQLPLPDMATSSRRELQSVDPSPAPTPAASPSASPAPLDPALKAEFEYNGPVLVKGPPLPPTYSTKGNDPLKLYGRYFPTKYARFDNNKVPLASLNDSTLAFTYTVVTFGDRCITDARDWKGREVMGLSIVPSEASATTDALKEQRAMMVAANQAAGCRVVLNTGPIVVTPRKVNEHSLVPFNATSMSYPADNTVYNWPFTPDTLELRTPPGIGVNRSIAIRVYDFSLRDGQAVLLSESNSVNFTYAPPTIRGYSDRRIYIREGMGATNVTMIVDNVGSVEDMPNWTPEEAAILVTIDGQTCVVAQKDYSKPGAKNSKYARYSIDVTEYLSCEMSLQQVKVGFKSATLRIAGQEGSLDANKTEISLHVVCNSGLFGLPNQTCLVCPVGAECDGWVKDESDANREIGALWGSSYYDGYGIHTPAIPLPNFYDLNGTSASACPPKVRAEYPDRDVCIVGCIPKEACLGNNTCSTPYISKAPAYRCAACNRGFYRRGIECIPCPSHPELVIVGVLCLLFAVAGLGYYLNRAKINIAMFSIGVDYFQVLAIFAQSDVKWPPEIKELYHLLSIFNLNIEIVAPECLVPDVSYVQKWTVIMLIPIGVYFTLLSIQGVNILYRICIKRMKRSVAMADAGSVAMSSLMTLAFLMYIYLCRNIFDVMTCTPVEPDDGQVYIKAAGLEPCGKPGGVQLTLLPWAIVFMLVYVVGYPAALTYLFVSKRRLIMEDQLLRTRDQGDDPLTNPHALHIRRAYSRAYYAFKPHVYFWNLAILARKLGITITFVIFAQNPYFQLAASLLVCFLAYAAQVRFNPYMPPQEYDEVYADHQLKSLVHGSIDAALAASLKDVFAKAKKMGRRNDLQLFRGDERVVFAANWIFNNNTVEACLLFSAVLVNLLGLMYASIDGTAYQSGKKPITYFLIIVIATSIIYFVSALFVEIRAQCRARAVRRDEKALAQQRANQRDKTLATSADVKKAAFESATRQKRNSTKLAINPMFTNSSGSVNEKAVAEEAAPTTPQLDQARQAIFSRVEPPDASLWKLFQEQYADVLRESGAQTKELNNVRIALRRAMDMLGVNTPEDLIAAINKLGGVGPDASRKAKNAAGAPGRTRTFYKPQLTSGGGDDEDAPMTNPLATTSRDRDRDGASASTFGSYNKMPSNALKLNKGKPASSSTRLLAELNAGAVAGTGDEIDSAGEHKEDAAAGPAVSNRKGRVSLVFPRSAPLVAENAAESTPAAEASLSPMRKQRVSIVRPFNGSS